ncbi:MAG: amidohydrolase family protein [Gordonibacter pamelaeae]
MSTWYPEADLVIQHPKIYTVAITCDEVKEGKTDFPIIEDGGVAAKDGKVIAVGTAADVQQFIGEHTEVIDASGKILTPGFVECHMHCKWTGEQMLNLDFNGVTSRQAILDAVAEKAANTPDGEWIEGDGWNELIWEDSQELITRRELDEIAPNNPVILLHMSVHTIAANSLALEACGYTKDTPQPEGAEIGHYDDGELDGLLYENGALQPMLKTKPARYRRPAPREPRAHRAAPELLRHHQRHRREPQLQADAHLQRGEEAGQAHLSREPHVLPGPAVRLLRGQPAPPRGDGLRHRLRRRDAEAQRLQGHARRHHGRVHRRHEPPRVPPAPRLLRRHHLHAGGDRRAGVQGHRARLAVRHPHHRRHERGPRAARLPGGQQDPPGEGAAPLPDPLPAALRGPVAHHEGAGRGRVPAAHARVPDGRGAAVLARAGRALPVAGPHVQERHHRRRQLRLARRLPDPMLGMYYAVTRLDETTGKTLSKGDESKVTPIQALIMWTKNAAFFSHDDDKMGSVEVGNFADFAILDRDCFASSDPTDIRDAKVTTTVLGGKVVYEA